MRNLLSIAAAAALLSLAGCAGDQPVAPHQAAPAAPARVAPHTPYPNLTRPIPSGTTLEAPSCEVLQYHEDGTCSCASDPRIRCDGGWVGGGS
ncbi:MAG: hypothetical protein JWM27_4745 [Gemmatimonadetes bacterium]|nr:hypothetical protein [Gemmatimonadota bacterium]